MLGGKWTHLMGERIVKPVETMDVWFDSGTMWANLNLNCRYLY